MFHYRSLNICLTLAKGHEAPVVFLQALNVVGRFLGCAMSVMKTHPVIEIPASYVESGRTGKNVCEKTSQTLAKITLKTFIVR